MNIKQNITNLYQELHACEQQFARKPNSVVLLAVTKQQTVAKIQQAIDAGQFIFGENYLQEALTKIAALCDPRIIWHFIGPIQSNKTKKIAEHFSWVQSVANFSIAKRLNDQRPGALPPLNICLQVNISQESSKSGVGWKEVFPLAEACAMLPRLTLRGIMAIPEAKDSFAEQAKQFHQMQILFNDLHKKHPSMDTLSMGMSNDMAAAISEGATMIRIGTKIFGSR